VRLTKMLRQALLLSAMAMAAGCARCPPEVITATGLSVEKNMEQLGIPAVIVPFEHPVPEGLIADPARREAMIEAKIAHLQEVNRLFWGDIPDDPVELQYRFDDLWFEISRAFPDFQGLDLDWDAFGDEYREKMGEAQSYGDYAHVLSMMGHALKESHVRLVAGRVLGKHGAPDLPGLAKVTAFVDQAPVFIPLPTSRIGACCTVTADEELVISSIWDGSPNPYGLQVGDEIVGLNGVPWEDWIPRLESAGIPILGSPGGAETARTYNLLRSVIANVNLFEKINIMRVGTGEVDTMDVVYVPLGDEIPICHDLTETEGLVSVDDPRRALSFMDDPMFVYGIIKDQNIGYVYIKSTRPGNSDWASHPDALAFSDEFEEAILCLRNTDGLILDLRTNIGGIEITIFYKGLAHLFKGTEDRFIIGTAVRDPEADDRTTLVSGREAWGGEGCSAFPVSNWFGRLCRAYEHIWGSLEGELPFPADDPDLYYEKPIIVMTGPDCVSSGEWLVQFLSTFPNVTIIGRDPNGSLTGVYPRVHDSWVYWHEDPTTDYVHFVVPTVAYYFVDEQPIRHLSRRTGVVDEEVWFTKEDLITGTDTVRARAIQLILEHQRQSE
jgi:C-terminal processing protease CtpA/Prc